MAQTETIDLPRELEEAVGRVLERACGLELRLATAESCTGGLVASMLTDVEGCSHAFERGFVVYTDEAKRELLGVSEAILAREGAVSKACALAMAEGALARSAADVAVALTGYAGPTKDGGEEGLVHLACAGRGRETRHLEARYGPIGRGPIRLACARDALGMLQEAMTG